MLRKNREPFWGNNCVKTPKCKWMCRFPAVSPNIERACISGEASSQCGWNQSRERLDWQKPFCCSQWGLAPSAACSLLSTQSPLAKALLVLSVPCSHGVGLLSHPPLLGWTLWAGPWHWKATDQLRSGREENSLSPLLAPEVVRSCSGICKWTKVRLQILCFTPQGWRISTWRLCEVCPRQPA